MRSRYSPEDHFIERGYTAKGRFNRHSPEDINTHTPKETSTPSRKKADSEDAYIPKEEESSDEPIPMDVESSEDEPILSTSLPSLPP